MEREGLTEFESSLAYTIIGPHWWCRESGEKKRGWEIQERGKRDGNEEEAKERGKKYHWA